VFKNEGICLRTLNTVVLLCHCEGFTLGDIRLFLEILVVGDFIRLRDVTGRSKIWQLRIIKCCGCAILECASNVGTKYLVAMVDNILRDDGIIACFAGRSHIEDIVLQLFAFEGRFGTAGRLGLARIVVGGVRFAASSRLPIAATAVGAIAIAVATHDDESGRISWVIR
jgi:hypothetical protein